MTVSILAGKGETFVCQQCGSQHDDRTKICHPLYAILVEKSSIVVKDGRVVDCQQAGKQHFRAARVLR